MPSKKTRTAVEQERDPSAPAEVLDQPSGQALALVLGRLDLHGEMLGRILKVLTEPKKQDGPSAYELLVRLVASIDGQSRGIRELADAVEKLGRDLPLDLVKAIDDNLDIPRPVNGHRNGNDPA